MAQWPTNSSGMAFRNSLSCLINPDPTIGPGFVDFVFLHVNIGDYFHGQSLWSNKFCIPFCQPPMMIDIAIFWPIYGQTGLMFALEIESSHGLEWF
jgi:hypothetical protein